MAKFIELPIGGGQRHTLVNVERIVEVRQGIMCIPDTSKEGYSKVTACDDKTDIFFMGADYATVNLPYADVRRLVLEAMEGGE